MSYGKVHEEYWEGEKIEPLSDRACLLGLYLITGPHRNAIGCFKLGLGAITDIPRFGAWGIEGVSKALHEMVETGFIVRDERTGWTLIANALIKDPIKGSKAAIHAAKIAAAVPANSVVYPVLKAKLEPQLEKEKKALSEAEGWPMRSPIEGVSIPHTIPKPSPSPLPEPEPKPEPQPEPAAAAEDPACEFIRIFDQTIVSVWGEAMARPWPWQTDLGTARKWLDAGVTENFCRNMCLAKMSQMKAKGKAPPKTLSYLDEAMADCLADAGRPMPDAAAKPAGGSNALLQSVIDDVKAQADIDIPDFLRRHKPERAAS